MTGQKIRYKNVLSRHRTQSSIKKKDKSVSFVVNDPEKNTLMNKILSHMIISFVLHQTVWAEVGHTPVLMSKTLSWLIISFVLHHTVLGRSPPSSDEQILRWLKTVSGTFQDVEFDGSKLPLFINWCYNHGIRKLPNHWWTRWYYFRHTIGYHSNNMTC